MTKKENKKENKKKEGLELVLEELRKKFGEEVIMKLKEAKPVRVEVIPTGSISLDLALGVGGWPRGRIIEIFGPESSGKTTLALHALYETQKQGGVGAFVDVEHALDPEYAQRIGVNLEELLISQPESGEEALQIVETLVRSGEIDTIVIDSVAALAPKAEIMGEIGEAQIGLQARLMSSALRKLSSIISKTKTVVLFLNQIRMKIGSYGKPETTPGGLALKFYASVRVELKRVGQIKKGEEIIGNKIVAKVVKNKVAAPFKSAEFNIYYNEGISKFADLINAGIKYGVIKKAGSWIQFEDLKLGQGLEEGKKFLKENQEIAEKIKQEIFKKIFKENSQ
jgi:recombination protein RecA